MIFKDGARIMEFEQIKNRCAADREFLTYFGFYRIKIGSVVSEKSCVTGDVQTFFLDTIFVISDFFGVGLRRNLKIDFFGDHQTLLHYVQNVIYSVYDVFCPV